MVDQGKTSTYVYTAVGGVLFVYFLYQGVINSWLTQQGLGSIITALAILATASWNYANPRQDPRVQELEAKLREAFGQKKEEEVA